MIDAPRLAQTRSQDRYGSCACLTITTWAPELHRRSLQGHARFPHKKHAFFDHAVGACYQLGDIEAESVGNLEIDDQINGVGSRPRQASIK